MCNIHTSLFIAPNSVPYGHLMSKSEKNEGPLLFVQSKQFNTLNYVFGTATFYINCRYLRIQIIRKWGDKDNKA